MDRRTIGGLAGMASPAVFTAFLAAAGAIVPGYDHVSQHVSELARQSGPHAWVMRLGLVIVGILDLLLARGLARGAPSRPGRIGSALVAMLGVATVGVGMFPLQPAGTEPTPLARAHLGVALTAFTLDVVTPLVFAAHFRDAARSQTMRGLSLASGILGAVLLVPVLFGLFPAHKGLVQRAFLAVPFAWTGIIGAWLLVARPEDRDAIDPRR